VRKAIGAITIMSLVILATTLSGCLGIGQPSLNVRILILVKAPAGVAYNLTIGSEGFLPVPFHFDNNRTYGYSDYEFDGIAFGVGRATMNGEMSTITVLGTGNTILDSCREYSDEEDLGNVDFSEGDYLVLCESSAAIEIIRMGLNLIPCTELSQ